MRHLLVALTIAVAALAGCGGGSKTTTTAGTPTMEITVAPSVPESTTAWVSPCDTPGVCGPDTTSATASPVAQNPNVGPLCANATRALVDHIVTQLGGTVSPAQFGNTPFDKLLKVSLNDCASRIEWLTAIQGYGGGNEAQSDGIFQAGCKGERFLNVAMSKLPTAGDALNPPGTPVNHPDAYPIPVACQ